ncbi:aminotransferase class V-fold PLP-dependent enzyme [Clostridium frigidicarnis]|uniref:Selenocysteine lyase/Cysteine desulfurase n=1 Tax=Clostridium frigidicarnis TaxID=84698 RepID=A0A1I0WXS7_9CLOT|nr:aminotransferase class V-fold PLP-dependent enzyme [Clostridium frigidicarnis]SFA93451.1 Selenocysteine lyase/Cysteine desulfurase [Clostridium frigidicarnis]
MLNVQRIRKLFPGLNELVPLEDGRRTLGINLDNAATTPPFIYALNSISNFSPMYSSIHRGTGYKSIMCSEFYEEARESILDFLNAPRNKYTVIFVKNTTEGLNLLSHKLVEKNDNVLSTFMEHHSNDLPWRNKCKLDYVDINEDGSLNMLDLESKLIEKDIKYLTVTGASNVTGCVNDINALASLCHRYGTRIIVDGAQLIPHKSINMSGCCIEEEIDFLVFSAHKMYAPFGIGVIVAKKEFLEDNNEPFIKGGGTVELVTKDIAIWDRSPLKDEGGTPNILGIVALISSMKLLNQIGMDNIHDEEIKLTSYLLNNLKRLPITVYGPNNAKNKVGIVSFNISPLYHEQVATKLSNEFGIAVRNGCFCAHPYVEKLLKIPEEEIEYYVKNYDKVKKPGMVRASLGVYNTREEIDRFLYAIEYIIRRRYI